MPFYLKEYKIEDYENLHLEATNWKCQIKKLTEGKLFDLLCTYEKLAHKIYQDILDVDLSEHFNCTESLTSIIYYNKDEGYHGEHTDYGLFNIVLNDDSENCMYYEDNGEWKLFDAKNKMIIMNGDAVREYGLKAVKHKVEKPAGFERYIATKICYPKNKKEELVNKVNWL